MKSDRLDHHTLNFLQVSQSQISSLRPRVFDGKVALEKSWLRPC